MTPLGRIMRHKSSSLKEMDGSLCLSDKYVSASLKPGSVETHRTTAVFQNAIDERAVNETLLIDVQILAFYRLPSNFVHGSLRARRPRQA
jgi:hypothetical protein